MTAPSTNPFPHDADRHTIWEILMRRDFEAFLAADWSMTEPDFLENEFQGLDAGTQSDPGQWQLRFPSLGSYRKEWLRQAEEFRGVRFQGVDTLDFFFETCVLREIQINGERAVANKKFNGSATTTKGDSVHLLWQTLYLLKKVGERWKITGFVGYLPNS